jgi:hypothetical protein
MATIVKPDNEEYKVVGNMTVTGNLSTLGNFDLTETLNILSTNNINLSAPVTGEAALNVSGGVYIESDTYIGGTLLVNGDVITLGNTGGTVTFNSGINSDVVPAISSQYNLGSPNSKWKNIYAKNILLSSGENDIVSGVVSTVTTVSYVDITSPAVCTLPNPASEEFGQIKIIVASNLSSPVQITPTTSLGYTSFVLTNTGDSITLMYANDILGWVIINTFRASVL